MKRYGNRKMGAMIQRARVARGLTRRAVGDALSLTDQYVYQVETGRRVPALETLWEFARLLDLDPHRLDSRLAPIEPD